MGFLGAMFDPNKSQGFQAKEAQLQNAVNPEQAAQANAQVQSGINQQQAFVNALGAQGGIQNQSNVFNQQQALANQLSQQAQGGGPNPALAQLNQATGQNVANQAALMASQRGASANPGMLARQAAQQGASIQQNAVGQAATMQAQQQLAAQHALQAQQGMMGQLATQQVGQQQAGLGQLNQASQGNQAAMINAINAQNASRIQNASQANSANAAIAQQNAQSSSGLLGGMLQGVGQAGAAFLSDERQKKHVKDGSDDSYKFLDALKPKTYEYKNPALPGAGPGEHVSVMAQDLEKTKGGKQMVKETPQGKMVDYGQGLAQMLAATADLHQRLKKLESSYADGGAVAPAMPDYNNLPQLQAPSFLSAPSQGVQAQPMPTAGGPSSAAGQFLTGGLGGLGDSNSALYRGGSKAGEAIGTGIGKGIKAAASGISSLFSKKDGDADPGVDRHGMGKELNTPKAPSLMGGMKFAGGGMVPAMLSPGEKYLPPKEAQEVAKGDKDPMDAGRMIKGKAKVAGDSLKNDTVPAKLKAGGVVIPRSIMQSEDPAGNAAKFVAAELAKKMGPKK